MDSGGHEPPCGSKEITVVCHRELLRRVGSVLNWCLKYGNMCDKPADFSAKVAEIIYLGTEGEQDLPAEVLQEVPEASVGSWWITEAAVDGHDKQTYKCLARHAQQFRWGIWNRERQVKRAKWILEVVESEMKSFRLALCFAKSDMEQGEADRHDEVADDGFVVKPPDDDWSPPPSMVQFLVDLNRNRRTPERLRRSRSRSSRRSQCREE